MTAAVFKNLNNVTRLHESLDWDDTQLSSLFEYLDNVFNADVITHPEAIYNDIEKMYGVATRKCFEEIFKQQILELNLHTLDYCNFLDQ